MGFVSALTCSPNPLISFDCLWFYAAMHSLNLNSKYPSLFLGSNHWIAPLISASFFLLLPCLMYICHHNKYTQNILYNGWNAVISAMVISRWDYLPCCKLICKGFYFVCWQAKFVYADPPPPVDVIKPLLVFLPSNTLHWR